MTREEPILRRKCVEVLTGVMWLMVALVVGIVLVAVVMLVPIGLDAPTIDPSNKAFDYPWRTKTILNAGGLGMFYWEGAECLVDLYGTFEPLGTYEGALVGRYTPREDWWGWWQCPRGTLVTLTWEESPEWKEWIAARREREAHQEAARLLTLRALTKQAVEQ